MPGGLAAVLWPWGWGHVIQNGWTEMEASWFLGQQDSCYLRDIHPFLSSWLVGLFVICNQAQCWYNHKSWYRRSSALCWFSSEVVLDCHIFTSYTLKGCQPEWLILYLFPLPTWGAPNVQKSVEWQGSWRGHILTYFTVIWCLSFFYFELSWPESTFCSPLPLFSVIECLSIVIWHLFFTCYT